MVKKAFALSLLFAISNMSTVRANECTDNICDTVTQSTEFSDAECASECLENAKFISINIEFEKKDDESWAPLAERTYAILALLENEAAKETTFANMKLYTKQMYEMARKLNVSGNVNLNASDQAPTITKSAPTMSMEDIINGNTISITGTIEKGENNCEAMQNIIDHAKTMIENENDCTLACIEGMLDAGINFNGTMSINVK